MNSSMFGQVETYLTKTVPEFMQKNFNARTRVGSFAIAGLSEGGTCAMGLALNNPKEYPVFANYSGDVSPQYQEDTQQQTIDTLFGGSVANFNAHNPPYLLARGRYDGLSGWFEAGQQDPDGVQAAHTLQGLAANAGIDTCVTTPPGAHNFDFFTHGLPEFAAVAVVEAEAHAGAVVHRRPVRAREELRVSLMAAAIFFATLSALSSACGAVLQRLAVVDAQSTTARPRWRTVSQPGPPAGLAPRGPFPCRHVRVPGACPVLRPAGGGAAGPRARADLRAGPAGLPPA